MLYPLDYQQTGTISPWKKKNLIRRTALVLLLTVLGSAGCALIPPKKITVDRINYLDAVSASWKKQLLNNLVCMRYGDTLTTLEMSSINTTYALDSNITASSPIQWNPLHSTNPASAWVDGFRNVVTLGGGVIYQDHPTIAYSPMRGDALAKTLIEPLSPDKILMSLQTGWDVSYVFACCVKSVNHLRNRAQTGSYGDDAFFQVANDIYELKSRGVLRFIVDQSIIEKSEKSSSPKVTIVNSNKELTTQATTPGTNKDLTAQALTPEDKDNKHPSYVAIDLALAKKKDLQNKNHKLQDLLGDFFNLLELKPNLPLYSVIDGNRQIVLGSNGQPLALIPDSDKIVMTTRSISEIINLLSMYIDVPTQDITEGRAKRSPLLKNGAIIEPLNGPNNPKPQNFIIHCSTELPSNAFAALKDRGYWFYIDDTDLISKEIFSAIAGILSMSETGTAAGSPVLTLPLQ